LVLFLDFILLYTAYRLHNYIFKTVYCSKLTTVGMDTAFIFVWLI